MRALVNYNLKKAFGLFLMVLIVALIIVSLVYDNEGSIALITLCLYLISSFVPFYCFSKDTLKFKSIYSLMTSDFSGAKIYTCYWIVGVISATVVFFANLFVAFAKYYPIDQLLFDLQEGIMLLPYNLYGIFIFISLVLYLPSLILNASMNYSETKFLGIIVAGFNIWLVVSAVMAFVDYNFLSKGDNEKVNLLLSSLIFAGETIYVIICALSNMRHLKKVSQNK